MICLQPRGTPRAGVCGLQTADPQPAGRECGLHIFDLQIDHVLTEHVCILFVGGLPVRLKGILVSFYCNFSFSVWNGRLHGKTQLWSGLECIEWDLSRTNGSEYRFEMVDRDAGVSVYYTGSVAWPEPLY